MHASGGTVAQVKCHCMAVESILCQLFTVTDWQRPATGRTEHQRRRPGEARPGVRRGSFGHAAALQGDRK